MRYAIISDIHANRQALEAALAAIGDLPVIVLGDMVGYGADPNAVCETLRARAIHVVRGNHDDAAVGALDYGWFNEIARVSAQWTAAQLTARNRQWLAQLPYEIRLEDALFVHGAPGPAYFDYITRPRDAQAAFERTDARVIFVGHSHLPGAFVLADGQVWPALTGYDGTPSHVNLAADARVICNVGSVGQPRDSRPELGFAIYDTEAQSVSWRRVAYDVAGAQAAIRAAGLPESNAKRLAP
jgi:diadenosine tetraphosphatase ApaH/serine/threonine PP2A family protein phosphatase